LAPEHFQKVLPFSSPDSFEGDGSQSPLISEIVRWSAVEDLKLHKSIIWRRLEPREEAINEAAALGAAAWEIPIPVTRSGVILDHEAIWALAKRRKVPTVKCIILDIDESRALRQIIINHREHYSFSKFARVELALESQEQVSIKAKENLRRGGKRNGLSKLADDQRVNRRQWVAAMARVGNGSVPKVEFILNNAIPDVLDAARQGLMKLEFAYAVSKLTAGEQAEALITPHAAATKRRIKALVASQLAGTRDMPEVIRELEAVLRKFKSFPHGSCFCSKVQALLLCWIEARQGVKE
jgi:hypothetical protein